MRLRSACIPLAVLLFLLLPSAAAAAGAGHYVPVRNDGLVYSETVTVTNGQGDYNGYTESSHYTGAITVTAVLANLTESAAYHASGTYSNNQGVTYPWSEGGVFTFSAGTYLYVQGTDNQTGYTNPSVWFYMNNSLPSGATFNLLNTPMKVVATDVPFPMASSSTGYVASIFAEGNGSYQRDDSYGNLGASYNWKTYFDPGTGYILGYTYTEVDSNASGDGFTYTDTLADTSTTFALTPTSAPSSSSSSSSSSTPDWIIYAVVAVIVIVVLVVIIAAVARRRAHPKIPRHPSVPAPGTMPSYAPPAPVNLIPRDQPLVQQVVIRETVKVPCAYCGTLIDSTATNCPNCGAART